jgi:hypothetical protein
VACALGPEHHAIAAGIDALEDEPWAYDEFESRSMRLNECHPVIAQAFSFGQG